MSCTKYKPGDLVGGYGPATTIPVKSKRGALKRRDAIVRELYRRFEGGTAYGIDMPTIRVCFPELHGELMDLARMLPTLPD
jgi:hypothetical protein